MPGYNCNWCKALKEEGVQSQTVKHVNIHKGIPKNKVNALFQTAKLQ